MGYYDAYREVDEAADDFERYVDTRYDLTQSNANIWIVNLIDQLQKAGMPMTKIAEVLKKANAAAKAESGVEVEE